MNFDDLFEECANDEKYRTPENCVERSINKMVTNIEAEFTGETTAEVERENERKDIEKKIQTAETELKKVKNPSNLSKMNYTQREEMSNTISKKREKIRRDIAKLKLRLDEIDIEEGKNSNNNDDEKNKNKNHNNKNNKNSGANIGFSDGKSGRNAKSKSRLPKIQVKDENKNNIAENAIKSNWQNTNPYSDL